MRADNPHNETQRLAALRAYNILDTLPEAAFDDLTLLASQICGTPVGLVSLIDRDRQWFKSKRGLDADQTPRDDAFCAHAIHRPEELLIVPDAQQDARFADNPLVTGAPHIRFYAGAPLITPKGEALGTLCVIDTQTRELSDDQQRALSVLSRQVMAQMELRRSYSEVVEQMAVRVQIEAALRESEGRFRAFMDNSPLIAFLKNERGTFTYVNQPFLRVFHFEMDEVIGHDDFDLWPEAAQELREHDAGVLAGEETVSLLETVSTPDGGSFYWQVYKFPLPRGGGEGRFLAGVALDVTQNKEREQQLEDYQRQLEAALVELEALSLTDALTGLNNRRAFDWRFGEEWERAQRYQMPLSVLMIDVDCFKAFNDSFGHGAGDELLQSLARVIGEKARGCDFTARYGGEEFVILLPNTASEGALVAAERFRVAAQTLPSPHRPITISIGVSSLTDGVETPAALLEAADRALYCAKQNGRNCVAAA